MEYQYIATTKDGQIKKGTMEASGKGIVKEHLLQKNLVIISIRQLQRETAKHQSWMKKIEWGGSSLLEKIIFARQLAVMLRAGLSLSESLESLRSQAMSKKMQLVIERIIKNVNNGQTLASSLEEFPRSFSGIFVGMVRIGEASGNLERNLEYVASELEKDYELVRKVKAAMLYPVIILSATFILGIGLTIFILPKLVDMFNTFRIELPLTTRIFLGISNFLVNYGFYVLGFLVLAAVAIRLLLKAPASRSFFHEIYLKTPLVKRIVKNVNLTRFSRVLSILLKSGVPITDSLSYSAMALGNVQYRKLIERARELVKTGQPLASVLVNEALIPKMMVKMINVGERTGKLEETLFYLSDFYEDEVNNETKNIATVIEPILLIIIGVVMGFLAVAIISPIYQFTGSLQR